MFYVDTELQHRLMGQPLIPAAPAAAYQQQLSLAMQQQSPLLRVPPFGQLGAQLHVSPRLATPVSQAAQNPGAPLMGMPPPLVSSTDGSATTGTMLYNTAATSLPGFLGQNAADLSPFGLVNQAGLFEYQNPAVDPSAAGMFTNTCGSVAASA